EGRGEGDFPRSQLYRESPSPDALRIADAPRRRSSKLRTAARRAAYRPLPASGERWSAAAARSGAHLHDELREPRALVLDDVARGLVGEHALLRVDLVLHHADEDFRPAEGEGVQDDHALSHAILHAP